MCKVNSRENFCGQRNLRELFPNLTYLHGGEILQSCFSVRTLSEVGRLLSAENGGIQGDLQKV